MTQGTGNALAPCVRPTVPTHQNWNLNATSTCRDGALMLGASEFGCPNSGRPLASVPARMDPLGTAKFARLVRLNNQGILGERG